MYNQLMDAAVSRLGELFPGYPVYMGNLPQEPERPCFFLELKEKNEKTMTGKRAIRKIKFSIRYIAGESQQLHKEQNQTAEMLMDGMEWIRMPDGLLVRGTDRKHQLTDGILDFSVIYSLSVYKEKEQEEPMENLEITKGLVKTC